MKFWEAVEQARKTGWKIKKSSGIGSCRAFWNAESDRLCYDHGGIFYVTGDAIESEWDVLVSVSPPFKEYSFIEAFNMMKYGKWMATLHRANPMRRHGGGWYQIDPGGRFIEVDPIFTQHDIEAKWLEVQCDIDAPR